MKAKHVFLTMGLSLVMGLGVAAGMSANREVKAANAANTIYLDLGSSEGYWTGKDKPINGYFFTGTTAVGPAWPGAAMSIGDSGYYEITKQNSTSVLFNVNGWNGDCQTVDLTLPTDGKNFFRITTNHEDGSNQNGSWYTYSEASSTKNTFYVYDRYDVLGTTLADVKVYGYGQEVATGRMVWPGTHSGITSYTLGQTDVYKVELSESYPKFIINNGTNQTVNVEDLEDNIGKVLVVENNKEDGKYKTYWLDTSAFEDYPAEDGYYVVGSETSWTFEGAPKLGAGDEENYGILEGYQTVAGEKFKVKGYFNGDFDWYGIPDDGSNYEADAAKKVDIYLSKDGFIYVSDVEENEYKVRRNDSELYEYAFTLDEDGKPEGVKHQYSATIPNAYRANELVFYKNETKMTSGIGVDEGATNNIVGNVTDGFKIYHGNNSMKVYLKEYDDGGCSLWGEGYAENEFYIPGLTDTPSKYIMLDNTFTPYGDYIKQYKSIALSIAVKGEEQDKYYLTDNGCSSMQNLTAETAGQNNAYMTSGSYFNVHNACNTEVYIKMKTDLSLVIYIGGYVEQHVMTIGGQEIALEPYEGGQYRATGVTLHAGDTLTSYEIDGVEKISEVSAKVVGNNNLGADKKVIVDATADIYYNVANKTLHVSGLPTGGFHIIKNGTTLITMTPGEKAYGYDQYYSDLLTFAVNDTLKFVNTNGEEGVKAAEVFSIATIDQGDPKGKQDCFTYDNTDKVIKCVTATSATVYLKINQELGDKVYFGPVPKYVQDAYDFANAFNTAIEAVCTDVENAETAADLAAARQDLEDAWEDKEIEFNDLSEQAQEYLKGESAQSVAELRSFFEKYDRVYTYRKIRFSWNLSNFLDRNFSNSAYINPIMINKTNSVVMVSIIASMVTLFASAGVVLFLFKKKKHN